LAQALPGAGIQNPLGDPLLELHDTNGAILETKDNWKDTDADTVSGLGMAPADDREAVIVRSLAPGNYTTIVRGKDDAAGVALVELYQTP
jgi:hypothetical protein